MTPLQQRTLVVAKRYIGASEDLGPNRGTVIQRFQLWYGRWMLGQSWCVAFAIYAVDVAAKELKVPNPLLKTASSSALYLWAKQQGRLLREPEPGCVFVVRRGGDGDSDGRRDAGKSHIHTGLVHDVEPDGRLLTLEGNRGDAVRWARRGQAGLDFIRI